MTELDKLRQQVASLQRQISSIRQSEVKQASDKKVVTSKVEALEILVPEDLSTQLVDINTRLDNLENPA